jgi:hypothetical protein
MSQWITDRLPTVEDGVNGHVLATSHDGILDIFLWNEVENGEAWQRLPAPYVKPKRWTVKYNKDHEAWAVVNNGMTIDLFLEEDDAAAAQRICDIYNEVLP